MDFQSRLGSLKKRRQGPSESMFAEAMDSAHRLATNQEELAKSEKFESLQESDGVKYAIGAMAAVDAKYTAISIKEGERVASSLSQALSRQNINVDTRLQGSVGLDVHIKGYSDVDMLVIVGDTLLAETPHVVPNYYQAATDNRPMVEIVGDLRSRSEVILTENFPAVNVNVAGGKSIALEGGSLARKVDIVPATWYHTIAYQTSLAEHDIGVKIYNKIESSLFENYPFLNRKLVNDADLSVSGNLKRIIRLMKNLQSDTEGAGADSIKKLNSFDVLSIAYDMRGELAIPGYRQLGLVDVLLSRLRFLLENKAYRDNMNTPDMTRKVFDNDDKVESLAWLYVECNDLASSLVRDISPYQTVYNKEVLLSKSIFD